MTCGGKERCGRGNSWTLSIVISAIICIVGVHCGDDGGQRVSGGGGGGSWELIVENSGVSAMHMTLTRFDTVVMYDRTDYGPSEMKLPDGRCREDPKDLALKVDCYAHSVELELATYALRPLEVLTDTWCSSGAFLPNGTLLSTGGWNDGTRSIRVFAPCGRDRGLCDWSEMRGHLAHPRWYASNQILPDGRVVVVGGRKSFSYEFVPSARSSGSSPFLLHAFDADESEAARPASPVRRELELFFPDPTTVITVAAC